MRERKSSTGSVTSTSTSLFSVSLRKSKTDNLSSIANGTVVQPLNSLVQLERLLWRVNNLISSDRSIVTGKSSKSLLLLKEYQRQIAELKEQIAVEAVDQYEHENRMQWVDAQCAVLSKIMETLPAANVPDKEMAEAAADVKEAVAPSLATASINTEILSEIMPSKNAPKSPITTAAAASQESSKAAGLRFSDTLQQEHDQLTNELVDTIRLIKRNNLHLRNIIISDDATINEASSLLANNTDSLQREGKNLQSYSRQAWSSAWRMLGYLFLVILVFLFMYIFIRFT